MPVNDLIILRKGTDAVWSGINPILSSGEPGYDSTYNLLKVGNGTSSWLDLNPVNLSGTYFNNAVSGLLPTISNSGDNRILTSIGSTVGINAESNLTFDGSILSISGNLIANTGTLDKLQFNINNGSVNSQGQMGWNSTEGTVDIALTDSTVMEIGQHRFFRIRNTTGSPLYKGQVVYASGVHANGIITPNLYIANGTINEIRFIGLVFDTINNNNNGYVIDFGHLRNLDLDGTTTNYAVGDETWSNGDILYAHPTVAGKLTKVAPKHAISLAIILDDASANGQLFVRPTNFGDLSYNHDVDVSGVTNGQFLQYNSVTDYWVPSSSGNFTSLQVNGTGVSISGHTHSSSDITNFNSSVSGLLPTITNSGDNRVLTSTGSAVGINAESNLTFDGSLLSVSGSGSFSSNLSLSNQTASTIAGFDSSKNIVSLNTTTYPSLTELSYVKGVTSSIQTQLDNKAASSHNHTSLNITDWNEAVDDRVSNLLVGISGINISYNDAGNILNIAYTGAGGGGGGVTINNYSNNRVLTSDGTSTGIDAENNLVFIPSSSGNKLGIGTINPNGNLSLSNGNFAIDGDSQKSFLTVRNSTTNNTSTTLYLDGSSTKIVLPPKSVWNFHINLSCYSDTNEGAASWNFKGCIKRTSNTTALVASIIEENFIDSSLNGVSATVVANTGTSSLDINVSGLNSNNIRWTAGVDFVQTRYDNTNYFLPMKFNMVP